ncbi:MAG: hypothetical protein KF900_00495 [Bacteroidetes bacterium]|nr:hypothetical protein [Bacteroidota bacterium]
MKKTVFTILTILCLTSCDNSANKENTQSIINADSIELTTLVRDVYEWHETKYRKNGFPFKHNTDSIFTGVDWDTYAKEMAVFKKTNFFSESFFAKHRALAMSTDTSIKQTSIEWRNVKDGIPIWETDADDWCNCQDYPDNYWTFLLLKDITIKHDTATFKWTWDNNGNNDEFFSNHEYEMKAVKENGTWKISYMEGFKNYRTASGYNQIISK